MEGLLAGHLETCTRMREATTDMVISRCDHRFLG
jgi:hypothetical protein